MAFRSERCSLLPVASAPGSEPVRCSRLGATLSLQVCLVRHTALWPSGRRRGTLRFVPCGKCSVGAERLRQARGWFVAPPPSQPAEVMSNVQRAAKLRYRLEHLDERKGDEGPDPFAVVAMMSPDDRAEWR